MLLPKFDYHEPSSLDEATRLMAEIGGEASVLAGGTDLLVNMKMGKTSPKHVVSLSRIGERALFPVQRKRIFSLFRDLMELSASKGFRSTRRIAQAEDPVWNHLEKIDHRHPPFRKAKLQEG